MHYKVNKEATLTDYLISCGLNKNKVKNYLKYKQVQVNNQIISQYNYPLNKGDIVEIKQKNDLPFPILYEDQDLIVINKPSGLLSERTQKSNKTAYSIVKDYLSKKHENIFLVHRLDQDTSGVLMFVKNKKLHDLLTKDWNKYVLTRSYYAIVEGELKGKGKIENYLQENKAQVVYIAKNGKKAITNYEAIKSNKKYTLVHLLLETGRKNQIRVHLASLKHPIVGDKKYGNGYSPIKRLALHADTFAFTHPITHKKMTFKTELPVEFNKLVRKEG